METKALFSSASSEWETPQNVYDYLNSIYAFELDPCSTKDNHKCDLFFTKEDDGLKKEWHFYADSIFMNPVYGNAETACKPGCNKKRCVTRGHHIDKPVPGIEDWMCKAYEEARYNSLVVCLIPARTDTDWWHNYCMKANEIWFINKRLSFINRTSPSYRDDSTMKVSPAPFPSAIVVFDGLNRTLPEKPILKAMSIDKKTGEIEVK